VLSQRSNSNNHWSVTDAGVCVLQSLNTHDIPPQTFTLMFTGAFPPHDKLVSASIVEPNTVTGSRGALASARHRGVIVVVFFVSCCGAVVQ